MACIEEKKNIKRNKIIEAATKLFVNNSFSSTAIDEVVKTAGVAKGTFYLYFKDKYDLLDQIISYKSAEVLKSAMDMLEKQPDVLQMPLTDKAIFLVEQITDYMAMHKDMTALLEKNLTYCFRYFSNGENAKFSGALKKMLDAFAAEGYSERKARMTLYIITDLVGSVVCDAVLERGPFTLEEIKPTMRSSIKSILGENE